MHISIDRLLEKPEKSILNTLLGAAAGGGWGRVQTLHKDLPPPSCCNCIGKRSAMKWEGVGTERIKQRKVVINYAASLIGRTFHTSANVWGGCHVISLLCSS